MESRHITPDAPLRVVADAHIPYLEEFAARPDVSLTILDTPAITPDAVRDAEALLVRTRTRCSGPLLAGSKVTFAGTATIGLDHIDAPWCDANGVEWTNAPGCNALAVAQYVLASLLTLYGDTLAGRTLGVIGVGHVGSIVVRWARALGLNVLCCDPPRAEAEGSEGFVTLDELLSRSEIVTLHTPLTDVGPYATRHMADDSFFARMRHGSCLVNAARGPVVDTAALLRAMDAGIVTRTVIDVWEGEPADLDPELLRRADIATPHIAGYSENGKRRATAMVLARLYAHFGLGDYPLDPDLMTIPETVTAASLLATCDPVADTAALRAAPNDLERLRNYYHLRPEPTAR